MRPAFGPSVGMNTVIPRVVVSAAAAAILLTRQRRKTAASGCQTEVSDKTLFNAPNQRPTTASSLLRSASTTGRWGLLLPSFLLSVSTAQLVRSWLAMVIAPFKSWAVAAVPNLQFADELQVHQPEVDLATVQSLCGHWVKDTSRSDSLDGFCQLFGVPRWLRQATRLITGLNITCTNDMLLVTQVCKISWLSTTEAYPLDGINTSQGKRRDMRSGKQTCQLVSASDDTVHLRVQWEGSWPGEARDTLKLVQFVGKAGAEQELVVMHEAWVFDKGSAKFKEVYIRKRQGSNRKGAIS